MSNSSIWPIDRILSGATNLGQNDPGSDGNVLYSDIQIHAERITTTQ